MTDEQKISSEQLDENTSAEAPIDESHPSEPAAGEGDNAFAGGVGDKLPGGENDNAGEGETEHPDTKLAAERLADLQRSQADFVNYRNRVERDRAKDRDNAISSVLEAMIPVLDDIAMARQHGDLDEGPMAKIAEKLESVLNRFGVERFGEVHEEFNPAHHEALMQVEADAPEGVSGTFVAQVLQPGYKVGDRVVRPARVSVSG